MKTPTAARTRPSLLANLRTRLPAGLRAGILAGILAGCQVGDSGTEIPNELRGSQFVAGPSGVAAAVGAKVRLVPIGHVPGPLGSGDSLDRVILSARTDERGEFVFREVPVGNYNVIAEMDGMASFRDSLFVAKGRQELPPDTLSAAGSLSGKVQLQPQHDPRTATVQVLGTPIAVNVDKAGGFTVPPLGEGAYTLRVVTTYEGYTPLYHVAEVRSGVAEEIAEPLQPFYSGIPVVKGLFATAEIDGTVRLQWQLPDFGSVQSYLVYRDSANAIEISRSPIGRTAFPTFLDTVYSRTPKPGQYPFQDTVARTLEYRVRIRDMSGDEGPAYGSVIVEAIPPTRALTSGLWRSVEDPIPFAPRLSASLVVVRDRMWLLGGHTYYSQVVIPEIYSTRDGHSWEEVPVPPAFGDSSLYFQAVALRDSIWVVRTAPRSDGWRLQLWVSGDGEDWRKVVDSIPVPALYEYALAASQDRLWILGGYDGAGKPLAAWRSGPDGTQWAEFQKGAQGPVGRMSAATLRDRLFVLDNAATIWSLQQDSLWVKVKAASDNGPALLERPFLSHGDKLWFLSGPVSVVGPPGSGPNQAWSSPDGKIWTQVDAIAPYGARKHAAAASFQGKMWIVGGEAIGEGAQRDIWYYDGPSPSPSAGAEGGVRARPGP